MSTTVHDTRAPGHHGRYEVFSPLNGELVYANSFDDSAQAGRLAVLWEGEVRDRDTGEPVAVEPRAAILAVLEAASPRAMTSMQVVRRLWALGYQWPADYERPTYERVHSRLRRLSMAGDVQRIVRPGSDIQWRQA